MHLVSCTMPLMVWLTFSLSQLVASISMDCITVPFIAVTQLHFFLQEPMQATMATKANTVNNFFIMLLFVCYAVPVGCLGPQPAAEQHGLAAADTLQRCIPEHTPVFLI